MMRNLKFCSNLTMMFQEHQSLLQRYGAAKVSGFRSVEVSFPYDISVHEIATARKESGMEQILINAYPGNLQSGEAGFAGLAHRENDFEKSLETSLKYAEALECKRIHFMSGKLQGSENSRDVLETLEKNLRFALPELEKREIVGLIEPINNFTVPNYVLSDFDAALSIIKSIDNPNIRLQLDLFHLQQIHGNLTKKIEELLPFTGHIQIAQVPGRNEPQTSGEIDYNYIFDLLEKLEYQEWIGLEYMPINGTNNGVKAFLEKFNCKL